MCWLYSSVFVFTCTEIQDGSAATHVLLFFKGPICALCKMNQLSQIKVTLPRKWIPQKWEIAPLVRKVCQDSQFCKLACLWCHKRAPTHHTSWPPEKAALVLSDFQTYGMHYDTSVLAWSYDWAPLQEAENRGQSMFRYVFRMRH